MTNCMLWIAVASVTGFSISALFAGWLKIKRDIYLFIYIPVVLALFVFFVISSGTDLIAVISHNWYWGLAGALIAGALVIKNVLSQPASEPQRGMGLIRDILWPGFFYGLTDALLLSVLPVLAVGMAISEGSLPEILTGRAGSGVLALMASLVITTFYHLGYPEFRCNKVIWANFGNGVLTLAYLITGNPLAAILPHIAMHIAAMIHGRETTGQVPPHYNK